MRTTIYSLASFIALLALGCSGGSTTTPTLPSLTGTPELPASPVKETSKSVTLPTPFAGAAQAGLGGVALNGDIANSALGLYTIEVDATSLAATAHLKQTRQGTANDDLYLLSIDSFLKPDSFEIRKVGSSATTVDLTYAFTHPFPAPLDPAGTPNGLTNRADLGIAGQIVFMVDVADALGNTYFDETGTGGGSVILNTGLVANADAFVSPAGLLTLSSIANTFPYQTLVDESADSRGSATNGGDVTGNFGVDGWTRGEMGATNDQWTGFGVLHQGQTSERTVSLDRAALAGAGTFSFDVAVLAKYNDPRGGTTGVQKKANRLPSATADASAFAYRMPHGALDVERIAFDGDSGGFWIDLLSASTLEFHVTDWDARAIETVETDLSADTDVTKVAIGESGAPRLAVCIPTVLGDATEIDTWDPLTTVIDDDSARGGDAASDSGRPGDSLYYSKSVTKAPGASQTPGTYTGLVRAEDPEVDLAPMSTPLDGSLSPLTTNLPKPIAYQAFAVDMIDPNDAPAVSFALNAGTIQSATSAEIIASTYSDIDGDDILVDIDWNGDGDWDDTAEATAMTLPGTGGAPISVISPSTYINTDLTNDSYTLAIRFTDGVIASPIVPTAPVLTVTGNRPPVVAGTPALQVSTLHAPAFFTMLAGTTTASDPEGDSINFVARANVAPIGPYGPVAALPISAIGAFNPGSISFTLYARDASHTNFTPAQPDSAVAYPSVSGTVQACPVAPFTAANIAGLWNTGARASSQATGNVWGYNDIAPVGFPNALGAGAVVSLVPTGANTPPLYMPITGQQLQRITAVPAGAPVRTNMTAWVNATILHPPATTVQNAFIHQIDVDALGRVLFLTRGSATDVGGPIAGTDVSGGLGTYAPTAAMHTGIKFIDFNWTTGAVVATAPLMITTSGLAPIAMTVDPQTNDVYTIDLGHQLRKYIRSGAATYTEVPTAQIDLIPILGNGTGAGAANKKIFDFVFNTYNDAFFILAQSLEPIAAPGNGYLYRVECNGVVNPNISGPGSNPARMVINTSVTQHMPADISIDAYGVSGILGAEQDVQILVGSPINAAALAPELRLYNSGLVNTANQDNGRNCSKLAVSFNDGLFTKGLSDFTDYDLYYPSGKPAGWD